MKTLYNEDYYERGIELGISGYSNYRWIPELTIPMASRICEILNISYNETILDFGCSKGYLVKAFRLLHRESYGVDLSDYAINKAPDDIAKYLTCINKPYDITGIYDWIISKDVFEHIPYENINVWLNILQKSCKNMFCIIPLGDGKKYEIPDYEKDVSHVIKESLQWWNDIFEKNKFTVVKSEYKVKYIKENWTKWKRGNGFFTLTSN